MARELGLGVTPSSPLKSGALSGNYTRAARRQREVARCDPHGRGARWARRAHGVNSVQVPSSAFVIEKGEEPS